MDIKYDSAAPLRYTSCRAWLVEYDAGGKDVVFTSEDMDVEDVIRTLRVHTHDEFTVGNISVGGLPIHPDWGKPDGEIPQHLSEGFYSLYFNDARKIDSEGMVQL